MKTVQEEHGAEVEIKRSRFIAHLVPFAQFKKRLEALREAHPKANHHVTAFRHLNEHDQVVEGSRDDGEPSGTSGPPALKVLQGNDLINVGVIIIRYFGGTKLGTGGLARAYALATATVIEEADLSVWQKQSCGEVSLDFSQLSAFERDCGQAGLHIEERKFHAEGVTVSIQGGKTAIDAILLKWNE
ncbi:IMPACT family protein [Aestuariispira insulae]|uniref:Putative YigZ family protein n=1 Tax=Aestuariispira insulae TaxID=1461337 RepID=A0A3D9HV99_9PROT|nr:YigZ family protein [Aestuariispira insulae]RED53359.1 putative YigZ family protein [Aestuariispira insulae]